MQLFTFILAAATAVGMVHSAPAERTSNSGYPSTDLNLPPGSIQIAEGLWCSNATAVGWNNTHLAKARAVLQPLNINCCGLSTFENRASAASPLVSDCKKLRNKVSSVGGIWTVGIFKQQELAQEGTCAFGVQLNAHHGRQPIFKVGSADIRDLLDDSIANFHWNDNGIEKVGTRGFMPCEPEGLEVEWGIYHYSYH